MAKQIQNPYFCRASTYSVLQKAVESGILSNLDRIAYCYVLDTHILYYVDGDHVIRSVVGDNKEQVRRVDVLPSLTEADEDVLYVFGNVVYTFSDGAFHPTFEALQTDIENLEQRTTNVETAVTDLQSDVNTIGDSVISLGSSVSALEQSVTNLEKEIQEFPDLNVLSDDVGVLKTDVTNLQTSVTQIQTDVSKKADTSDVYTQAETDQKFADVLGSYGGEDTVTDYVDTQLGEAKKYTDEQIELHIV